MAAYPDGAMSGGPVKRASDPHTKGGGHFTQEDDMVRKMGTEDDGLTNAQREHLLSVCHAILNSDEDCIIATIVAWPDAAQPRGVGTTIVTVGDGPKGLAARFILTESEAEARRILTKGGQL
jgi:hypothetical protein